MSSHEKKDIGLHYRSGLYYYVIRALDNFDIVGKKEVTITSTCEGSVESEFEHYSKIFCPCVGYNKNENLSSPQKELILWKWRVGTSIYLIQ